MADHWLENTLHPQARYLNPAAWCFGEPLPPAPETAGHLRFVAESHVRPPDGWALIRQTRVVQITPETTVGAITQTAPVQRPKVIDPNGADWTDWIDFHWTRYAATHQDNPPTRPHATKLRDLFGNRDLVPGTGQGLLASDGSICGIGSLRCSSDAEVEVGWLGTLDPNDIQGAALLLGAVCDAAIAAGIEQLMWEVDDTDQQLWELHRAVPAVCNAVWLTWGMDIAG